MYQMTAETKREKFWRILRDSYFWLFIVNFVYFTIGMNTALIIIAMSYDMEMVTSKAPNCLFLIIFAVKITSIWLNQKDYQHIFNTLKDLFPSSHEDQMKYKTGKYLREFCILQKIQAVFAISALLMFSLNPIFKFIETGIWINPLPYTNWFPFDPYCPELYTIVLLWQYWLTSVAIIVALGMESVLYCLIILIAMQFDILKIELSEFKDSKDCPGLENMKKLIDRQNLLIELCDKLETIFAPSLCVFITGSSFNICLCCFQLSVDFELMHHIKFGMHLCSALLRLWLLFMYGQSLIDSSLSLTDGIYESKWYESENQQIKKGILLIMLRAQSPSKLTGLKFTSISLLHFGSITSIWLNQKDYQHIFNTLKDLFPSSHEDQMKYKTGKYLREFCKLQNIHAIIVASVMLVFSLTPIFKFIQTGIWINPLPYTSWFPFDPYCPELYTIVLLWQYWLVSVIVIVAIGIESIMYCLIILIAMQFDILKIELSEFKDSKDCPGLENMKKLIDRQNLLIELCGKLETIFAPSLCVFITGSSFNICLLCFQLSVDFELMHHIKFGIHLCAALLQLWLLFMYGQSLIDSSSSLSDGIYESKWYESENQQIKKGILLIMLRAQSPSKLTSLKFTSISLLHFGSILNSSYSYYTLLRTLYDQ
ncbi:unnamed protein product [Diamesa serratosioi]